MVDDICLSLERKLHQLRIAALEKTVKNLTIKLAELEGEEDDFKVGNCVRLKDQNDVRILEVTRVTAKCVWVRQGNNNAFLKRKDKVEKIELNR